MKVILVISNKNPQPKTCACVYRCIHVCRYMFIYIFKKISIVYMYRLPVFCSSSSRIYSIKLGKLDTQVYYVFKTIIQTHFS